MKKFVWPRLMWIILLTGIFSSADISMTWGAPDSDVTQIFQQQTEKIVLIASVHKQKKDSQTGTGFIVQENGLVMTNYHLIKDAKRIFVKLQNKKVYSRVQIMKTDPSHDIALLKIDAHGLPFVKLGNSNRMEIGERVVAIGNPLGLQNTVSDGLVSAWREGDGLKLMQVSVPLSNGSSGGPLFNLAGEVVGVTTASLAGGQNLNFAVPVNYVKSLLREAQDSPFIQSNLFSKYVIQPNDTLFRLAKKFRTTVGEIMALNDLSNTNIYTGQTIKIPR